VLTRNRPNAEQVFYRCESEHVFRFDLPQFLKTTAASDRPRRWLWCPQFFPISMGELPQPEFTGHPLVRFIEGTEKHGRPLIRRKITDVGCSGRGALC
jgi:hypothetical protein